MSALRRGSKTQGVASIYRIHETPDPKRIVDFEETAGSLGIRWASGACR